MANPIRIKRRAAANGAGAPTSLANAELAYNEASDILYYGTGTGGSGGSATQVIPIAGKGAYVDVTTNQTIGGTKTFSNTITGSVSGSAGSVVNTLTIGSGLTNVGGSTFDGSGARTIALPTFSVAGSYGSSTAIPQITVDTYGRITAASTTSISTTINLAGSTGTGSVAGGGTLTVSGANGFTTVASGSTITVQPSSTTGSGAVVFASSPVLTTPTIGAATATSITGSSGNLTITAASGNNNVKLVPTGTGVIDASSFRISNVLDPVLPLDAVNKQYADAIASSLNIHGEAQAATTASVSYTYTAGGTSLTINTIASNVITFSANHGLAIGSQIRTGGSAGNGLSTNTTYYVITVPNLNQVTVSTTPGGTTATLTDGSGLSITVTANQGVGATLSGTPTSLDGYTILLNDRILVKDHATAAYNGIYTVTVLGTGSNGLWTRATDFDNSPTGEISAGDYIFVGNGTINGKTGFVQTTSGPIIVGVSNITFTQFTAANSYVAGTGINISGNTISIASGYTGQTSITTLGTIGTGVWNGSIIGATYGGTGVNNGSNTITLGGSISTAGSFTTSGAYSLAFTTTASTSLTLPTSGTLLSDSSTIDGGTF